MPKLSGLEVLRAIADDYTAYYGADGNANVGRDEYVRVCKYLRRSFPDVAITIEDLVVEGDKIVNRYIERGTLTVVYDGAGPAATRIGLIGDSTMAALRACVAPARC